MLNRIIPATLAAALLGLCASQASAQTAAPPAQPSCPAPKAGEPVECQARNAKTFEPAFPGQTRAPYAPSGVAFEVQTVAEGLENPWGMAFLPDGRMLVTEKAGRMRIVTADGKVSPPIGGVPAVDARQGGGLLGIAVDPDFATTQTIFWCYADPRGDGAGTTAVRARFVPLPGGGARVEDVKPIYMMKPTVDTWRSFGCRIAFGRDKTVYISTGDLDFDPFRPLVQDMSTTVGKMIRVNRDGSIPADNPYVNTKGVPPEVFATGFRNSLGLAIDPATGKLWENENGPRGGDELNQVNAGKNYGWPVISYGTEYSGAPVEGGITQKAGMEQPVYYWDPVIAPGGMTFYTGGLFPAWKGSLFVGSMRQKHLDRLVIKNDKVVGEERLLVDQNERIRDVVQGPDGALYVLTDDQKGRMLKLVPPAK